MRKAPSLFCFILLFANPLLAQDAKPPFSERTGIKGINFMCGLYVPQGLLEFGDLFLSERYSPGISWAGTKNFDRSYTLPEFYPSYRVELVLSPFRKNSQAWKRNIEWTHGILFQNYKQETMTTFQQDSAEHILEFKRGAKAQFTQIAYQSNVLLNFLITGRTMLYAGAGAGIGLPLNGYISASEIYKTKLPWGIRYSDQEYVYWGPGTSINSSNFNVLAFGTVGIKYHLSCRINLTIDYALASTWHQMNVGGFLPDHRHGVTFSFRYKFNRPPEENGEGKQNEEKPFW